MLMGFIKASDVGPSDDPTAMGSTHIPWELMVSDLKLWSSDLPLFQFVAQVHSLEQLLMHMTAEDTVTVLYDACESPIKIQTGVYKSCDDEQIVRACRKQVDLHVTDLPVSIERYLRSAQSDPAYQGYVPPSVALTQADRVEMLERAKILFISKTWFMDNLQWKSYLTARVQRPRWFHFWADAFKVNDPLTTMLVEGIIQYKKDGAWIYPKCDPGLISFWKSHTRLWNKVDDLRSISLMVDESFPVMVGISNDKIAAPNVLLSNVRMLPVDHCAGSSAVGVRVSPTFGTGGIFVIPNADGGLVRGELGDFPRPEMSAMKELLAMPKGKATDFWERAASKVAQLSKTYEAELLQLMGPPRIRMWPARKAKLADSRHQLAFNLAEREKFSNVPQAWQLVQSAKFEDKIPELQLWDPGAKWLANTLCMMTAMRHMRAATLFEAEHTTDLYDPEKLAYALLTAPASDFHAIWLCRVLGGGQEVLVQEKQEIKGSTLTETADAIFG